MLDRNILKIAATLCFAVLVLAGCREEEQGRPLDYEPGVYKGERDKTPLSESALADLRQRALMQGGSAAGAGASGGGTPAGSDVRPPQPSGSEN